MVDDELAQAGELSARAFDRAAFRLMRAHARHALRDRRAGGELRAGFAHRGLVAREVLTADALDFLERQIDHFGVAQHL